MAELFYPKELKEMIRKLEAEKNIRYEPLDEFNKGILFFACMLFMLILICLIKGAIEHLPSLLILFALVYVFIKMHTNKLLIYCLGSPKKVLIKNIRFRYFMSVLITYEILETGRIKTVKLPSFLKGIESIKEKELIFYCIENGNGMPNIGAFKRYFCLRNDVMKESDDA